MVISIIGSGALGKLYGGLLALSGHDVHFLMRSEYGSIGEQGYFELHFKEHHKTIRIESPNIHIDSQSLPPSDLIILTLKTSDNDKIEELTKHALKKGSTVLIVQNGIGNEEVVKSFCSSQRIISAISTAGATRVENGRVDVYFLAALRIASLESDQTNLKAEFEALFKHDIKPTIELYEDYQYMRWQKLIWSVPICTLSIIYDKPADILASTRPYVYTAEGVMSELQDIAAAYGIKITNEYIRKTLETTRKVKDYYPSMYWDYVNNRPIEREYIIDNVVKLARQKKVATPFLNLILQKFDELIEN